MRGCFDVKEVISDGGGSVRRPRGIEEVSRPAAAALSI
jgi:hypothetical protein